MSSAPYDPDRAEAQGAPSAVAGWARLRRYLWAEWLLVYGGAPLLITLAHKRYLMVALLWGGALVAHHVLKRTTHYTQRMEWNLPGMRAGLKEILLRFALVAPFLLLFAVWHDPQRLFSLPRERPQVWVLVMLLYPILSVWPQEIIFRTLLFHRYRLILPTTWHYALASAIAFGYAHLVFMNWIAIVLTAGGGLLFAYDYARYRSLGLLWLEHALYGCWLFTIGLGWYFYGMAWAPAA
jgi:hypothetical protein